MKEEQLIFLISQPRSGSTLTQKILGTHPTVYTRSEPWIMLPSAYNLKPGIERIAKYDTVLENKAINIFFNELPNKRKSYLEALKDMHLKLYAYYLKKYNKKYFLDKTPRYSLVTNELHEIFPKAKYIFLIRNPLSVLNSLIPRKETLYKLSENKYDLIESIDNILDMIKNKNANQYVVNYESILNRPQQTIKKLCDFLKIDYEASMLEEFVEKTDKWEFGDQNIYDNNKILTNNTSKWMKNLDNPQYWRLFYDYLNLLGEKRINELGYNFQELKNILIESIPLESLEILLNKTIRLEVFLNNERDALISNYHLQKEIEHKNSQVHQKQETIQQKNKELATKEQQLTQRTNELKEKKEELSKKNEVIEKQTKELQSKEQIIQQKNKELATKEQQLTQRTNELEQKIEAFKKLIEPINQISKISTFSSPIEKLKTYKMILKIYHKIKDTEK